MPSSKLRARCQMKIIVLNQNLPGPDSRTLFIWLEFRGLEALYLAECWEVFLVQSSLVSLISFGADSLMANCAAVASRCKSANSGLRLSVKDSGI